MYATSESGKDHLPAAPASGTSLHLTMDDIAAREKIKWTQVPFKGTADSIPRYGAATSTAVAGTPDVGPRRKPVQLRVLTTWGLARNKRSPERADA